MCGIVNRTHGGVNRTNRDVNRTHGGLNRTNRDINRTHGDVNRTHVDVNRTRSGVNRTRGGVNRTRRDINRTCGDVNGWNYLNLSAEKADRNVDCLIIESIFYPHRRVTATFLEQQHDDEKNYELSNSKE
jgi:hypothetical protein